MRERATSRSWFGWPVPSTAKLADHTELEKLILTAERNGFSRTAKGTRPDKSQDYVLMPYLLEPAPAPAWICMVISVPPGLLAESGERPRPSFARLDVSLDDFKKLRGLNKRQSSQLLQWLAWEASRGKLSGRTDDETE
ncbi:hypothetical protein [Actinoplanes sp. GCM10030250]|uniref:hypothetical protein n=1 Tax=Actinoplanes sp. GCM10030250 TaxID=3273376 RepID=UPI00360F7BA4